MTSASVLTALLLTSSIAFSQGNKVLPLDAPTTLPIEFAQSVSADHAKPGEVIQAKTIQRVVLPGGGMIPSGSRVTGHILSANGFHYDETPYAKQKPAILSIHFDSVEVNGAALPLHITVRAIATPLATWDAQKPQASDMDPLSTTTQIGGDQLIPSQKEVRNMDGDVVAYNRGGGVYAHLIANGGCDGSDVEVSVAMYSASACGAYGFNTVSVMERGSSSTPSQLTLASTHGSPKIWKHTTALLEVLPQQQASIGR